jgi:outer membrane protein
MIKIKIVFIFLLSFLFLSNIVFAEVVIKYIDMEIILTQSKVATSIKSQLDTIHKSNIIKFEKNEKQLTAKEKDIVSKKNVLSKEDFEKQIKKLREEANLYIANRNKINNELQKKQIKANQKMLSLLNPILAKYSDENSISIILKKNNMVIGKTELDVTEEILKIVNKDIKTFKLN